MEIKTSGTKQEFVQSVSYAIQKGKQSIKTNILVDGVNELRGFALPKPQTSGTFAQQKMYADMQAERIYTNFFTTKLEES